MIEPAIFYGVKCNRCHDMHSDSDDTEYFYDEGEAIEQAMDDDWIEKDGKHYCPSCYEGSEDDGNLKIKPEYPKEVFKVAKFLSNFVSNGGGCYTITENEDSFVISCCQNGKKLPDEAIREMIKRILVNFTYSYSIEDFKNASNSKLFVKINK